jgi:hypothetical protein
VGVPARYNTGFVVQEFDEGRGQWVMRGTHAHAWAMAWVDGRWVIADNTPPGWLASDSELIPSWQGLLDWWDERRIAFEIWRENSEPAAIVSRLSRWGIALVVAYALLRFWMGQKKKRRAAARMPTGPKYRDDDTDSHWSRILPELEGRVGPRPDWLPSALWVEGFEDWPEAPHTAARVLVDDHNLRRFGKIQDGGRDVADSEDLDQAAETLREQLKE